MQIENEYGSQSKLLGAAGYNYMTWAANMAVQTGTGVPWVMCKEEDAPDPIVSNLTFSPIDDVDSVSFIELILLNNMSPLHFLLIDR